jgi:hypothetical protein
MRYGEQETSAILRRAAEIQAQRSGNELPDGPGLSLAEIERAAADVGIRPEFIRAAVAEKDRPRLRIVPSGMAEMRREVAGPVSEAVWREMVDALQQSFGKVGVSGRTGDTFEWQLKSDPDPHARPFVHVYVHSRSDGSEIVLRSAERQIVTRAWFIGGLSSAFVSLFFSLPMVSRSSMDLFQGLFMLALFAGPFFIATGFGIKSWLRKDRIKRTRVMDLLGYVARGSSVSEATYSTLAAAEVEPQPLTLGRSI